MFTPRISTKCFMKKRQYYTIMETDTDINSIRGSSRTRGISFSPADQCRDIHLSLLSKNEMEEKLACMRQKKLKKKPYHKTIDTLLLSCFFSNKRRWEAKPRWYFSRTPLIRAMTIQMSRWPFGELVGTASNHDPLHL